MTKEEYKDEIAKLQLKFQEIKNELDTQYALSNSPYKVGDIIQDHYHIIKVAEISMVKGYNGWPQCIYIGTELSTELQPKKRQLDTAMYQENVKRKIQ